MAGNSSHHEIAEISPNRFSHDSHEEDKLPGATWYSNRREIEEDSPSRRDGIDLKKETYLRKSYCTFLQDLGMRLKVPQVTIATAVIFCHRFFLRQSHAKSDRRTIATVCMFLAGKVEETPRPLKDVILVSYEIIHKKDPVAVQKIKQRDVYEQQKELILIGERLVLATLGFDLNVQHPYKPLVESIKKFKIAQSALAQVAWNFVNDGLRTSLCLQFKPHHIAAGAIFLAAKFLKVRLPSDGDKVWWQEFEVTPRQLEEISNQMLELYEQNRPPQSSHGNDEGSSANVPVDAEETTIPSSGPPSTSTHSQPEQFQSELHSRNHGADDHVRHEPKARASDIKAEGAVQDHWDHETGSNNPDNGVMAGRRDRTSVYSEGSKLHSPMMDAMRKIDKDKVKAALEKRRRSRADVSKKMDLMDEDDLIERELEHGVELAIEDERNKLKGHNWSRPTGVVRMENSMQNAEEGELSVDVDSQNVESPKPNNQKRKAAKHFRANDGYDLQHYHAPSSKRQETY